LIKDHIHRRKHQHMHIHIHNNKHHHHQQNNRYRNSTSNITNSHCSLQETLYSFVNRGSFSIRNPLLSFVIFRTTYRRFWICMHTRKVEGFRTRRAVMAHEVRVLASKYYFSGSFCDV
jgi:hypothetical protein